MNEGHSVESLAAYSKGFVAGLDGGLVALFDRDEREYYRRTRTFTVMEHLLPVRCDKERHHSSGSRHLLLNCQINDLSSCRYNAGRELPKAASSSSCSVAGFNPMMSSVFVVNAVQGPGHFKQ